MIDYEALGNALALVQAARREAQEELDAVALARSRGEGDQTNEEEPQALAALVRQLDTAARELQAAVRTGAQQLPALRTRLSLGRSAGPG